MGETSRMTDSQKREVRLTIKIRNKTNTGWILDKEISSWVDLEE